jgi:hypothetical protein
MTDAPQQHSSPHDRPPIHTHHSDPTATSSNAAPYQAISIPCDGQNQPGITPPSSVPDHRPLVGLLSPSNLPNLTLFEASGNHGVTPAVGSPSRTNSVGAGIMPELRHDAIIAPPVHHNLSQPPPPPPPQRQSMAHVQQHALAASPIAPNQGVAKRVRPPPKVWCHECKAGFHAKKALNRHLDDCHSEEKKCIHSNCDFTYVIKRKLEDHLQKIHGKKKVPR